MFLSMIPLISGGLAQSITTANSCSETIYLAKDDADYDSEIISIGTGSSFGVSLSGTGNSIGVSLVSDFWATTTPKLILGYTVDTTSALTYYSVGTVDGNPFASLGFSVTSNNAACEGTTSANGVTYACPDSSSLTFTAC